MAMAFTHLRNTHKCIFIQGYPIQLVSPHIIINKIQWQDISVWLWEFMTLLQYYLTSALTYNLSTIAQDFLFNWSLLPHFPAGVIIVFITIYKMAKPMCCLSYYVKNLAWVLTEISRASSTVSGVLRENVWQLLRVSVMYALFLRKSNTYKC